MVQEKGSKNLRLKMNQQTADRMEDGYGVICIYTMNVHVSRALLEVTNHQRPRQIQSRTIFNFKCATFDFYYI